MSSSKILTLSFLLVMIFLLPVLPIILLILCMLFIKVKILIGIPIGGQEREKQVGTGIVLQWRSKVKGDEREQKLLGEN